MDVQEDSNDGATVEEDNDERNPVRDSGDLRIEEDEAAEEELSSEFSEY